RGARAEPEVGPGAARFARGRGRDDGELYERVYRRDAAVMAEHALTYLRSVTDAQPRAGVVLGSGLAAFADELTNSVAIPYGDIPEWPQSTAIGHAGRLVFGNVGDLPVVVMAGRAHLYEGYSPAQATFGVRQMGRLGVRTIVFTNAAGGINLQYSQGALVLISDHINLQ